MNGQPQTAACAPLNSTARCHLLKPIRPKAELLWLSTVDRGRELEIHTEFGGFGHTVAAIVADESDESLWLQLEVAQTQVQIPLSVLRDAIASSGDVHSEAW